MRFDTINAASYLVWRLQESRDVHLIRDDGDMILLQAQDHSQIMIYMVERVMTPQDLLFHLQENTQRQVASLMIHWVDMLLPRDGSEFVLTDWMSAMLHLQGDKIYGYEVAGREAYFFPVHFRGQGYRRQIEYGDPIDFGALRTHIVDSDHHVLRGTWRVGTFERNQPGSRGAYQDSQESAQKPEIAAYFEMLGLHHTATIEAVKYAYYGLARQYHPDLNNSDDAHQRMKRINEAYTYILRHFEEHL